MLESELSKEIINPQYYGVFQLFSDGDAWHYRSFRHLTGESEFSVANSHTKQIVTLISKHAASISPNEHDNLSPHAILDSITQHGEYGLSYQDAFYITDLDGKVISCITVSRQKGNDELDISCRYIETSATEEHHRGKGLQARLMEKVAKDHTFVGIFSWKADIIRRKSFPWKYAKPHLAARYQPLQERVNAYIDQSIDNFSAEDLRELLSLVHLDDMNIAIGFNPVIEEEGEEVHALEQSPINYASLKKDFDYWKELKQVVFRHTYNGKIFEETDEGLLERLSKMYQIEPTPKLGYENFGMKVDMCGIQRMNKIRRLLKRKHLYTDFDRTELSRKKSLLTEPVFVDEPLYVPVPDEDIKNRPPYDLPKQEDLRVNSAIYHSFEEVLEAEKQLHEHWIAYELGHREHDDLRNTLFFFDTNGTAYGYSRIEHAWYEFSGSWKKLQQDIK